jgi:RimJ/RimL family protein N-acetyltransferase
VPAIILTPRLELVPFAAAVIDAIVDGAAHRVGLSVPEGWPDAHDDGFLRGRRAQMQRDPSIAQWVRAVVVPGSAPVRALAGHAGFHGPPGVNGSGTAGALEIGYTIFPPYRGLGYATEVAEALIAWAGREHGVRHFFASVAPDNAPSLAVVARLGFARSGEQWDDEDGLELVFERRTG